MVAVLLGVSIIFSPILLRVLREVVLLPIPPGAGYMTYGFGIVVFMTFILVMHRTLPGRSMRGTHLWPGMLVTTILWVVMAGGFTTYLSFTPTYTVTYGTLAGVIITLMFFYLTGATIIYGAEVNAALDRTVREENARILARSEMGATWRWD
jgi:membrane protein